MKTGSQRKFSVSVMRGPHLLDGEFENYITLINEDVKLLKVALLYGDDVELISQSVRYWDFVRNIDEPNSVDAGGKRATIEYILAGYSEKLQDIKLGVRSESTYREESLVNVLRESIEGLEKSPPESELLDALWPDIAKAFFKGNYFADLIPELATIERLIGSRRLSFYDALDMKAAPESDISLRLSFDASPKRPSREELRKLRLLEGEFSSLFQWIDHVVANSENFPMLDNFTGTIAKAVYRNPVPPAFMRMKAVPLASRVFGKLEHFDKATLDEIIGIRKELDRYIRRFQNAVAVMATSLAEIPERDFDKEVEKIWITEILPELAEIGEKIDENKYLRQLATTVFKDPKALFAPAAGGGVGFAVTHDALGLIGGLAAAAPAVVGQSIWQYARERDSIRRRKLFFLYSFERSLHDRKLRHRP